MDRSGLVLVLTVLLLGTFWRLGVARAAANLGRDARKEMRRASVVFALWISITGALAATGKLESFESFPPPLMICLLFTTLATVTLAFTRFGTLLADGLAWPKLVGYQSFRIFAELAIAFAVADGIAPEQMTLPRFAELSSASTHGALGRNLDLLTSLSAPLVALALAKLAGKPAHQAAAKRLALLWNVVCLGLLINVVTVGMLSLPTPLRAFHNEPANTWIGRFPYVWLATVLVQAALFGHLVSFRKLWRESL